MYLMKSIPLEKLNAKQIRAALNEAQVLKSLTHPNIIKYIDSFHVADTWCIVMEYAQGGDLNSKLKQQHEAKQYLTETQVLDWYTQICLAVRCCHEHNIMHRDLKTHNIFLTNDGIIKLGDFGLSRIFETKLDLADTTGLPVRLPLPSHLEPPPPPHPSHSSPGNGHLKQPINQIAC